MARYTGPKVSISRRLSVNIFENEKGRQSPDSVKGAEFDSGGGALGSNVVEGMDILEGESAAGQKGAGGVALSLQDRIHRNRGNGHPAGDQHLCQESHDPAFGDGSQRTFVPRESPGHPGDRSHWLPQQDPIYGIATSRRKGGLTSTCITR